MPTKIDDDVLDILRASTITDDRLILPPHQLDRALYSKTDAIIKQCGGRWNTKAKAHLFNSDARDKIEWLIETGVWIDLKKELSFFETPRDTALYLVSLLPNIEGKRCLEPSAGTGNLVRALAECQGEPARIDACEINQDLHSILSQSGATIVANDFLAYIPATQYDLIVANPPFNRGADIVHVSHMLDVLKPGGMLTTIMSPGIEFRSDKKITALRNRLNSECSWHTIEPLRAGAFKESGTMVSSVILLAEKLAD